MCRSLRWSLFFYLKGGIGILIENQKVETNWNATTKEWYENKGYIFTKYRDKFLVDVRDLSSGSSVKIQVKCDYCGEIIEIPYYKYTKEMNKTGKVACKKCAGKKLKDILSLNNKQYYDLFVDSCIKNGYKPMSKLSDYNTAHGVLLVECPKHGIQKTTYVRAKEGHLCPKCGHEKGSKKNTLSKDKVIKLVENKKCTILNPEEYIAYPKNNLKIRCHFCGEVWTTSLASFMNSSGLCPTCATKKNHDALRFTPQQVKKIIESVEGNILLNPHDYRKNNIRNLKIQCGQCGRVYTTSLSNYIYFKVDRCPICAKKESQGERIIREYLEDNNIEYIQEKRFDDCKDKKLLPFDFYLQQNNLCIEFDGPHHYMIIYGDEERFKTTQKHDNIKNKFCASNGIDLLRIPYWEGHNIEQILKEKLHI